MCFILQQNSVHMVMKFNYIQDVNVINLFIMLLIYVM
ncbi:hypothetical protein SEEN449_00610 [Salmonella enterica subsp. enterica serovar Newport str. CVM 19449]|nr:hypothetical protein SEEN449_00610 [Salmonella enterica subsp. enterica serovar Newport str. CVM 19449]